MGMSYINIDDIRFGKMDANFLKNALFFCFFSFVFYIVCNNLNYLKI